MGPQSPFCLDKMCLTSRGLIGKFHQIVSPDSWDTKFDWGLQTQVLAEYRDSTFITLKADFHYRLVRYNITPLNSLWKDGGHYAF